MKRGRGGNEGPEVGGFIGLLIDFCVNIFWGEREMLIVIRDHYHQPGCLSICHFEQDKVLCRPRHLSDSACNRQTTMK